MKHIFRTFIAASLVSLCCLSACTGKFEEINTNPDALDAVPFTNMLANTFRNTASEFGGDLDGYATWAGYIVKVQYPDYYDGVIPSNNTYGNRWYRCYYNITQLNDILDKTEENPEGNKNLRNVCKIWQNFMWTFLLEDYGDVPYSESQRGIEGIVKPKYDAQSTIWPSVLNDLKAIADNMAAGHGSLGLGDGDFMYGGDMLGWQKFCNSLRLRSALLLVNIDPNLARSTVEEIFGNPSKYPVIEENEYNCIFWWDASNVDNEERWYNNMKTRDDHALNYIFIDAMVERNDPRLSVYAKPARTDGVYRGYINGDKTPSDIHYYSRIGAMYREDKAGFFPYYRASQTFLIRAEAAARGWNVGMSAEEAYNRAVELSMEFNGVDASATAAYLEGAGKFDASNALECIYYETWMALFKQTHDAWTFYRRTGYPTNNYISVQCKFGTEHNDQPFRICYPQNELTYNGENAQAAEAQAKDYVWGFQLWWDTRTGVR